MMTPPELDTLANLIADRVLTHLSSQSEGESLIDIHAAAEVVGCSVSTIERLTRDGVIPSFKIGRLRRYRRSDLVSPRKDTRDN